MTSSTLRHLVSPHSRVALRTARGGVAALLALACTLGIAQPASSAGVDPALARLTLPPVGLRAHDLAVVVNDADPASVELGRYYAAQRGIAAERVVHVRFTPGQAAMRFADFERVQAVLDAKVAADVQGYALAWTMPYKVECMSVTAAFALGFDPGSYCAEGCQTTKLSPYFNSGSRAPYTDHRLRPAMLLAGIDIESAKRLVDRGLRSDETWPEGKAYLMNTSDGSRNVRAESYERVRGALAAAYPIEQVDADGLEARADVMFEFTGVAVVPSIASNHFVDGAIADHLTSFGGALDGGGQTTALEWLTAGATGSYGTSSEPCNFRAKFPEIGIVMARYLGGETLLEAYWKSVRMPGQGVFVGDPLARPFGGVRVARSATATTISTRALPPGNYLLEASAGSFGPFRPIRAVRVLGFGVRELTLPARDARYFRLRPVADAAQPASPPAAAPSSAPQ